MREEWPYRGSRAGSLEPIAEGTDCLTTPCLKSLKLQTYSNSSNLSSLSAVGGGIVFFTTT